MPAGTKRVEKFLDGLTEQHEGLGTPYDSDSVLAAQIIRDLCNSDFRIADRVDEQLRASESRVSTPDTKVLNQINASASEQKEAVAV